MNPVACSRSAVAACYCLMPRPFHPRKNQISEGKILGIGLQLVDEDASVQRDPPVPAKKEP